VAGSDVTVEDLVEDLRTRGHRVTTARRAVLAELIDAGDGHLGAEDLAARINARHPDVHLSTVYRTLDALCEAGLIAEARLDDHPATYHLAGDVHHHAVCTDCGATINLPAQTFDQLARRLVRDHGFHADPHHLTIAGRCQHCFDAAP
jgi:Fe2+ or Zn2+ uptake regulation protein